MSIADKLVTIAENMQTVYDVANKSGEDYGYDWGKRVGIEEGQQAQYDLFWDTIQNKGAATDYEFAFYKFPAELFKPKYDFIMSKWGAGYSTFAHCQMTDLQKNCDLTKDYQGPNYTFNGCSKLVNARTIKLDHTNKYVGMFNGCTSLEEVRITGNIRSDGLSFSACTKLSKESIESVINTLSATTSGLTVTFSLTAVNKAFETSLGANDGSTSSEWTTLRNSKSNWTISLA